MPHHRYEPIPISDGEPPRDRHYFTGIPSTAPPSFRSIPIQSPYQSDNALVALPHRHDETAATVMPTEHQRTVQSSEENQDAERLTSDGINLWGTETSASAEVREKEANERDAFLVKLLERVEALEMRMESSPKSSTGGGDIESLSEEDRAKKIKEESWTIAAIFGTIFFCIWFFTFTIMSVEARHSKSNDNA